MKSNLGKALRSPRLALVLFLAIAALAVVGTIFSEEQRASFFRDFFPSHIALAARFFGLTNTYRSPLFLGLMLLLILNIALCTWHRTRRRLSSKGAGPSGRLRPLHLLDAALHLSILIVLSGGALKGVWGFIGTQNVHVGLMTETVYDWSGGTDAPLGFGIHVKERVDDYYPLRVRVGIGDLATGSRLALLELREGGSAVETATGLKVRVPANAWRSGRIRVAAADASGVRFLTLSVDGGEESSAEDGPFSVSLVAYRRDLRSVRVLIGLNEDGREVGEGWLAPNGRLSHRNASLFLTGWGVDAYGNSFVGIQVTRDPGAPLFWAGCILLSIVLPLYMMRKGFKAAPSSRSPGEEE